MSAPTLSRAVTMSMVLSLPVGRRGTAAQHDEAGLGGAVVDRGGDDLQSLQFRAERGAERGGVGMLAGEGRSLAGAGRLAQLGIGKILREPFAALGDDLRMAVDVVDGFLAGRWTSARSRCARESASKSAAANPRDDPACDAPRPRCCARWAARRSPPPAPRCGQTHPRCWPPEDRARCCRSG